MNKKLNVGVIIDITPESGGKLHMAISMCKYLKQIKEYNFVYITTFKGSKKILNKKLGIKTLLFNKIEASAILSPEPDSNKVPYT